MYELVCEICHHSLTARPWKFPPSCFSCTSNFLVCVLHAPSVPLKLQNTVMWYSRPIKVNSSSIVKMISKKVHKHEQHVGVSGSKAFCFTGPADRVTERKHVLGQRIRHEERPLSFSLNEFSALINNSDEILVTPVTNVNTLTTWSNTGASKVIRTTLFPLCITQQYKSTINSTVRIFFLLIC